MPYITGSYLVQRHAVTAVRDGYTAPDLDADMAFCRTLRDKVSLSMFDIIVNIAFCRTLRDDIRLSLFVSINLDIL